MDICFCVEAIEEVRKKNGCPEVFNIDQSSQFTNKEFNGVLLQHETRTSMDGRGQWVDNACMEGLWRRVKCEKVYLNAYDLVADAKYRLGPYFEFYSTKRRHQSLGITPENAYYQ